MAVALQQKARKEVLRLLKTNAALGEHIPAARWYGQSSPVNPTWPFGKLGFTVTRRLQASCLNGGIVSMDLHAFSRAREVSGTAIESAEDYAGRIGGLIETALRDNRFPVTGLGSMHVGLSDMRLMQDDEPDAFHYFAQVNVQVIAE